jgi:cellulose synthase/poly-beta-1,6-N-acetylglucosamine synthase-like glycosyltransferase
MDAIFGLDFSISLYLLASLTFFVDLTDLLMRLYWRREQTLAGGLKSAAATSVPLNVGEFTPYEMQLHLRPYALIVSVHDNERTIGEFLHSVEQFRDRLWFIDDGSTDKTVESLHQLGARCMRGVVNRQKPAAIKALLTELPPDIVTVVVLDPDSRIVTSRDEFERSLFQFQRSGMAAVCPRLAIREDGWLTWFQKLEYWLAFSIGRKSLADYSITSGIAIYRRDALEAALAEHSMSVYAEDLENSFILLSKGERVYYDGRIVIETEGMRDPRRLFSQRVGWYFGLMRVYVDRGAALAGRVRQSFGFAYQFLVYMGVFVLLFHPLKIVGLALIALSALNVVDLLAGKDFIVDGPLTNPFYFAGFYIKYTALVAVIIPLAVGRGSRKKAFCIAPAYTFYALVQVIPATMGYANWLTMRLWGRRVYRDHYQPATP